MPEQAEDTTGGATRSSETAKPLAKSDMKHLRAASTATSSSEDGTMTPMSNYFEQPPITPWSVPCPGKTYRIYLKGTDKVIMVAEGNVVVQATAEANLGGGWNWACVEAIGSNWLGFRNHVSGKFLGRGLNVEDMVIRAEVAYHTVNDCFCMRQHPDGGYLLLVRVSQNGLMQQLGVAADGKTVIAKVADGALWLFEEV